ncbi:hypothetical protein GUITHDRAFT_83284 [Guillardia theta CCMP2712]|uniref:Uncharacterized protein n=1 Tax=Guillardia theta (strain CCMP2712) TaxID=905079 RepID=L1I5X9_GUITC|nr:hypothetical protein GUITHDRAFT_83284 [Guillardia theta CCMP2712]EKX31260.1 hypothetical protein GUITHDRAFT_83284 [Guillardia theta CCMP2712]|eukprot:XP_005818240.1 hypothetical protein GUITHDRAFT_83284 [Guillardia theta CCMP2712]
MEAAIAHKVVVVGDSGVGKTALLLRFVQGTYTEKSYNGTIGGTYMAKIVTVEEGAVNLKMWDTAGQERFRSMLRMYYRNASAALLCCDLSERRTFLSLAKWVEDLRESLGEGVILDIACTKNDLKGSRVSIQEVTSFAEQVGANVTFTSAKSCENVDLVFEKIARRLLKEGKTDAADQQEGAAPDSVAISLHDGVQARRARCAC